MARNGGIAADRGRPRVRADAAADFDETRFTLDGKRLAPGDNDGAVFICDVATLKRLDVVTCSPPRDATATVSCRLRSPDGA